MGDDGADIGGDGDAGDGDLSGGGGGEGEDGGGRGAHCVGCGYIRLICGEVDKTKADGVKTEQGTRG